MSEVKLFLANKDVTELVDVIKVYIETDGTATIKLDWNEGEDVLDELKAEVWVRLNA